MRPVLTADLGGGARVMQCTAVNADYKVQTATLKVDRQPSRSARHGRDRADAWLQAKANNGISFSQLPSFPLWLDERGVCQTMWLRWTQRQRLDGVSADTLYMTTTTGVFCISRRDEKMWVDSALVMFEQTHCQGLSMTPDQCEE